MSPVSLEMADGRVFKDLEEEGDGVPRMRRSRILREGIMIWFSSTWNNSYSSTSSTHSTLKLGDYPKTHSITRLLRNLREIFQEKTLEDFYEEELEMIHLLEEAYIIPREYGEDIARRALEFAEKALEVMECLEKRS